MRNINATIKIQPVVKDAERPATGFSFALRVIPLTVVKSTAEGFNV